MTANRSRHGATLATLAAQLCDDYDRLILWEPIINGKKYLDEVLRGHLTVQLAAWGEVRENRKEMRDRILNGGRIFVDGYPISKPLFTEMEDLDLSVNNNSFAGECLILQVCRNERQPLRQELSEFASVLSKSSLDRSIEQPFWRETKFFYARAGNLTERTKSWLEEKDG